MSDVDPGFALISYRNLIVKWTGYKYYRSKFIAKQKEPEILSDVCALFEGIYKAS